MKFIPKIAKINKLIKTSWIELDSTQKDKIKQLKLPNKKFSVLEKTNLIFSIQLILWERINTKYKNDTKSIEKYTKDIELLSL